MATVNLTGTIRDISGNPIVGASILAKPLKTPLTVGQVGYSVDEIVVKTDDDGNFSIPLEDSLDVDVIIPILNYRRTLKVPLVDSNLFEIP